MIPEHIEHPNKPEHPVKPDVQPIHTPEQVKPVDKAFEQYKQVDEKKPDESPYVVKQASKKDDAAVVPAEPDKTDLQIEIETVLADGLETAYQTMTPPQQEKFRLKGEEVAKTIEQLSVHFKLTARRVLRLITEWLRLIPGVNKYFLEQEAKLKTDDILKLHRAKILKDQQRPKY